MTSIQWTDETWNPVTGCTRVSEGCRNCYIEKTLPFRMHGRKLGDPIRLHHDRLDTPLMWKKPRRIFVNSLSDLFHEDVPFEFIAAVFGVMAAAPEHTFQVLTKRPERMQAWFQWIQSYRSGLTSALVKRGGAWPKVDEYSAESVICAYSAREVLDRFNRVRWAAWPLPNVWLGVSIEDQCTADGRLLTLMETPAAVRWVSYEPALAAVDLRYFLKVIPNFHTPVSFETGLPCGETTFRWIPSVNIHTGDIFRPLLDWVVVGGESGRQARPCNVDWIRSVVRQCQAAKVPVFVKQLGSCCVDRNDAGFEGDTDDSWPMETLFRQEWSERNYQGTLGHVRLKKKGGDPEEWPEDLRVREWPQLCNK